MRLCIIVNTLDPPDVGESNFHFAASAASRGHEVSMASAGGFAFGADEVPRLRSRSLPQGAALDAEGALAHVRSAPSRWLEIEDLDALLLRNNPFVQKPWARDIVFRFASLARRRGVVVWNEPRGLFHAADKLYLLELPATTRPPTLVTRNVAEIEGFIEAHGDVVVKPLGGSGGKNVFGVRNGSKHNLEAILETVRRDGYVVVQEYVPAAVEGDTRLILLEGEPIEVDGKIAAVRRVRSAEDLRSNVHAGGSAVRAEVTDGMLEVARAIGPRLVADGLHWVGLDLAGDLLLEVNVFAPGGVRAAGEFEDRDFLSVVVQKLERAVQRGVPFEGPARPDQGTFHRGML